jgi:hypothetical protein
VRHGVRVGAGFRSGSAWPRVSSDARAFAGLVGSRRRAGAPYGIRTRSANLHLDTSLQHLWQGSVCATGALVVPRWQHDFACALRAVSASVDVSRQRDHLDIAGAAAINRAKIVVSVRRSEIGLSQKFIEAVDHK